MLRPVIHHPRGYDDSDVQVLPSGRILVQGKTIFEHITEALAASIMQDLRSAPEFQDFQGRFLARGLSSL